MQAAFYKANRPGWAGLYNRAVRAWERGPYSHCELVFSDGVSASASFMDGGVRFKQIDFDPQYWDFIGLPDYLEKDAYLWFQNHEGESYDLMGNLHLIVGFVPEGRRKKFCSEAVASALGIPDAWRLGPNALYSALALVQQPLPATGLFLQQ